MPNTPPSPKCCPVCGNDETTSLLRTRLVFMEQKKEVTTPIAYRCAKGHVFLSQEHDDGTTTQE
jgi:hypothetical protein